MSPYGSSALSLDNFRGELEAIEARRAVSVAVLDLDDFAPLNDSIGGAEADAVLARTEEALRRCLGSDPLVCHVKGDEFAAALLDAPAESLLIALESARRAIQELEPVTISAGVAGRPQHGDSVEELLAAADSALVRSKREGGNRISIATEGRMVLKTSYYPPAGLYRLAKLSQRTGRPEASLLREALEDLIVKHADLL